MGRITALICALVLVLWLACGAASASAADVVPVAGPWHATTDTG